MEETKSYQAGDTKRVLIEQMLKEVIEALEERGYQPINQLVGYLMSGDPGYISSHKEARTKIQKYDRAEILEFLLSTYRGE
ncbi:MAG: IreB family regulatory phosphoprotein [Bacilli bacterium]|nr:IreB family regulatory phosphoprotein [Bacilli bacterium]